MCVCVCAHTSVSVCMRREGGHKKGKVVKNPMSVTDREEKKVNAATHLRFQMTLGHT